MIIIICFFQQELVEIVHSLMALNNSLLKEKSYLRLLINLSFKFVDRLSICYRKMIKKIVQYI